jgi:hypothetical protein
MISNHANIDGARCAAAKTIARPIKSQALADLQILDAIAHQVSAPDKKLRAAIGAQPAVPSSGMPLYDGADISSLGHAHDFVCLKGVAALWRSVNSVNP